MKGDAQNGVPVTGQHLNRESDSAVEALETRYQPCLASLDRPQSQDGEQETTPSLLL